MCGRYSFFLSGEELAEVLGQVMDRQIIAGPRFNVAPTQKMPVVTGAVDGTSGWKVARLAFGWPAGPDGRPPAVINAREETVHRLPLFRDSWRERRCVVLASGFFEWQPGPRPRQPWFFSPTQGRLWGLAGIWTPAGFVIVTRAANDAVAPVHGRMPQILPRAAWGPYLSSTPPEARDLLAPISAAELAAWPVSRAVNRPSHDAADCIAPAQGKQHGASTPDSP